MEQQDNNVSISGGAAWSPITIGLISLFFTFLPGGVLYAFNYERLGYPQKKKNYLIIVIASFLSSALTFIIVPDAFSVFRIFIILNTAVSYYFYQSQIKLFALHLQKGGTIEPIRVSLVISLVITSLISVFSVKAVFHRTPKEMIEQNEIVFDKTSKEDMKTSEIIDEGDTDTSEEVRNDSASPSLELELFNRILDGNIYDVKNLVEQGADVNVRNEEYGQTPLIYAANVGKVDIIEYLIEKGADVNARDKQGFTPIMYAANGHLDAVKLLVEKGADLNIKEHESGQTVLYYAASRGHIEISDYLIGKGLDIKVCIDDGSTALMDVFRFYHDTPDYFSKKYSLMETVKYLLKKGIDPAIRDSKGKTALDYALEFKADDEIMRLLKKAMIKK